MAEILKRDDSHYCRASTNSGRRRSERGRQNWEECIEEASVVRYALVESTMCSSEPERDEKKYEHNQ